LINAYEDRLAKGITDIPDEDEEKELLLIISKILESIIAPTEYLMKLKGPTGQD
jgi:hypothetical protein